MIRARARARVSSVLVRFVVERAQRRRRCVDNQDYVGGYTRGPAPAAWQSYVPLLLILFYILLSFSFPAVRPPSLPRRAVDWIWAPDPPWARFDSFVRHRSVARVPVLRAPHYLQFARYRARKCEHRACILARDSEITKTVGFPDLSSIDLSRCLPTQFSELRSICKIGHV